VTQSLKKNSWSSRAYTGLSDQALMAALSSASPPENLHIVDLPYRFSSGSLDDPENARLWFDEKGQLVAWAVMQVPFWAIDYALTPGSPSALHRQVLAWTDERARALLDSPGGHPCWFINVFSDQTQRICDLNAIGFFDQSDVGIDSWSKVFMHRPTGLPVKDFRIPLGFTIRPLHAVSEVPVYVELHQAVFETKNMSERWRRRIIHHPAYRPEFDIVAVAPDGRLGAFCIGWLHRSSTDAITAQIEPLGCHPDFRRFALGRLVLAEAVRRLQNAGASVIYVETDNDRSTAYALYESLGFQVHRKVLVFRKNYGEMND
jgi:ribosomal protein S18 acetylase RimI-like enzyme